MTSDERVRPAVRRKFRPGPQIASQAEQRTREMKTLDKSVGRMSRSGRYCDECGHTLARCICSHQPTKEDAVTVQTEPGIGDISPLAAEGVEIEPMALIDTTGSMTWPNDSHGGTARKDVLGEAMGKIVERLGAEDSQAEAEKAAGEDAGGLMTVTFAQGNVQKIGDLSVENWREKWGKIQWGNGTEIMPGWNALNEVFLDEFGSKPALDRPTMLALVITDGEAIDTDAFAEEMGKVGNRAYVVLAIMGYGEEHDRAKALYDKVAEANDHVRVVSFGNTDDPERIANATLSLVGVK